MALSIMRQGIEVERFVGISDEQMLIKAETMVSGAGRDAVKILLQDAELIIGSVEVQAGRVVLDGMVVCQAIYRLGEDPTVRALTAQSTFSHVAEIPEAGHGMAAQIQGNVERVTATYENGHMIFQTPVSIRVGVTDLRTVELIERLEGIDGLEQQFVLVSSMKSRADASQSMLLSDEVALPAALDARLELMHWATAKIEVVNPDLGGVRVIGNVQIDALISSGVETRPAALVKYALPFDQLVEMPEWLMNNVAARVEVKNVSISVEEGFEGDDSILRLEAEAEITVRAYGQDEVSVLQDAYATGDTELEVQMERVGMCTGISTLMWQDGFKGTVLLEEGTPGASTVLAARARPVLSEFESQNGHTTFQGVLEVDVLYIANTTNQLTSVHSELPFEVHVQGEVEADAWVKLDAVDADASTLMSDRLEFKCSIRIETTSRQETEVNLAMDVQEIPAQPMGSGIVIAYPGTDESLWNIGKRYRISTQDIQNQNTGVQEIVQGQPVVIRLRN